MSVKAVIDNLRLEANPAPSSTTESQFKEGLWVKRLNSVLRRLLREGMLWNYTYQMTLSTGTNTLALPTYFLLFRKFSGQANSYLLAKKTASDLNVPMTEVEEFDIVQSVPEAKIPSKYYVSGSTVTFDHNTTEDLTVDMQFYRTLETDLTIANDIDTVVPIFDDTFQDYLTEILMSWIQGMKSIERGELIRVYASKLQYLRERTFPKENQAISGFYGTDSRIRNIDGFSAVRSKGLLWP